jgi:hypothetical protein
LTYPPGGSQGQTCQHLTYLTESVARTGIVGHVNQEVRDLRFLQLFDRSIDIKWELVKICVKSANKHLPAPINAISGNAEVAGERTTPVLLLGKMYDLTAPVLPFVGGRVGTYGSGSPVGVFAV